MDLRITKVWVAVKVLALVGMGITVYLTYQHFANPGGSFCNVSEYVSCDIVNKSIYSELFGIPVSILGFGAYTFFFVLSFFKPVRNILWLGTIASGAGLLFSLYLTYIEFFVLRALCMFCVTQQILILALFILFTLLLLWSMRRKS